MSRRSRRSSDGRIRVCVVAPSLDILGGQAVLADRLVARLRSEPGIDVDLLPVNPRLPWPVSLLQRVKYARTVVTSTAYLALLLRRLRRCEVVHAFSASYFSFLLAPVPAMIVGRLYRRRVILNYHSGEAEDHLRRSGRIVRMFLRLADSIVVPSQYLVEVFGRFGHSAVAIPNFVEVEAYAGASRGRGPVTFLTNRNLEAHYGVDVVLRAFARIQRSLPDARLIVAGYGSQEQALRALAIELGLANVDFRGRVSPTDMPALYAAADVFVNASLIDNMPLSILEAAAAGIPIVTSRVGGIPFMVADDVSALLVPPADERALADAAIRVAGDSALADRLATGARRELELHWVWRAVRESWTKVYTGRLQTNPHGGPGMARLEATA